MKRGTCIQNKMHNLPFENNRSRAREILELVHTDLNGPHATVGFDGSKYFLTFIDDHSKCALIYTIKSKININFRYGHRLRKEVLYLRTNIYTHTREWKYMVHITRF